MTANMRSTTLLKTIANLPAPEIVCSIVKTVPLVAEINIADCRAARGELAPQHPARHGVELLDELGVARLRRGDQRVVERAVGTNGTRLVLTRKITRQPRHELFG